MTKGTVIIGVAAVTATAAAAGMSKGRSGRKIRRRISTACKDAGYMIRSVGNMID